MKVKFKRQRQRKYTQFQATSVLTAILGVQTNPIENSNSKLLELINEKRSWKDAKAYCAQSGAELVHVNNWLTLNDGLVAPAVHAHGILHIIETHEPYNLGQIVVDPRG